MAKIHPSSWGSAEDPTCTEHSTAEKCPAPMLPAQRGKAGAESVWGGEDGDPNTGETQPYLGITVKGTGTAPLGGMSQWGHTRRGLQALVRAMPHSGERQQSHFTWPQSACRCGGEVLPEFWGVRLNPDTSRAAPTGAKHAGGGG